MLEKNYPQLLQPVVNINLFRSRKIRDTYFRTKISIFHNPHLMLVQMVVNIYGLKRQKVCPAIVSIISVKLAVKQMVNNIKSIISIIAYNMYNCVYCVLNK